MQWRGENDREPARYGKAVTFGNIRDKATAYMSYSDRVGPGIVVLGGTPELCDRLTLEGFTALAPDLPEDRDKAVRVLEAAIDHLADNWHPRVGLLAFGTSATFIKAPNRTLDAVVALSAPDDVDDDVIDDFRYDLS